MAEIVNLRLARKQAARRQGEAVAAENRARHGATKLEKRRFAASEARAERELDGAKRDVPPRLAE